MRSSGARDKAISRRAGLRRARDEGKQLGRPKIGADTERAILADLRKKDRPGVRVIAAAHGVSVNTVQRVGRAVRCYPDVGPILPSGV